MRQQPDPALPGEIIHFHLDRRARVLSFLFLVGVGALIVFLFYNSGGTYLPAWFTAVIAAALLLALMSVPRYLRVSPHMIEIHGVMELTTIPIRDIKTIRHLSAKEMKFCLPVWGIYGMLGYFGYYINLRDRSLFRLFASRWKNFVLIENIYEERFVISCDKECFEFIRLIESYRKQLR